MLVIRATAKLRKHWKIPPPVEGNAAPNNPCLLGDLYAQKIAIGRRLFILGVFERTYMPLIIPVAQLKPTVAALRETVMCTLCGWGIPPAAAEKALPNTETVLVLPTASRTVLGVINDFTRMLQYSNIVNVQANSHFLGMTPVGPLAMESPERATVALLTQPRLRVVPRHT